MFGNSKEYQDIQKLYAEKVSKPEQLDEKPKNPLDLSGALNRVKQTGAKNPLELSMPSTIKKDTTPPPETKTETPPPSPRLKADITTNQRQSRALAADDKNVKLNKFSRTQRYAADAKGVKLVPGAKVGQTVNRSTVQTKAAFDFGGIKKGERLGVMTRNQRRKYDLMAAQRAKDTTPPPEKKTTTPPPEEKKVTTQPEKKTDKKIFTASDMMSGKKPTSDNKGFENVDKKNTEKKSGNILDKSGLPSRKSFIPLNQKDKKPMGRDAAKRRQEAMKRRQSSSQGTGNQKSENPRIQAFNKQKQDLKTTAKYGSTATIQTQDGKTFKPGDPGYEEQLKKARQTVRNSMKKEAYEPYDIVLEYLLSSEQAATIEEANYIMTEMDAETIQGIVSEGLPQIITGVRALKKSGMEGVKKGVKKVIKKLKGGEMKGDFPTKGDGSYTA